ncbi:ATP-binding region ATPase domain protein [Gemmatirosa kalamazoonensis]|uniref:histidine kinase n=1 Tax=Gemmatirosa kalamazoonensis TaxID=861299 RepID=W0RGD5_9BACT|nr:HAMP domain-containing sensor histidine kinase [Gemmatirosa kalamazoonensis]AHG89497.1 ATP-binding region ATPase domain protein [Gemmatirosa kalamazoonensis]
MSDDRRTARGPLGALRRQLIGWYVATFCAVLALLLGGLYLAIRHQFRTDLDRSLADATEELERAARIREMEASATGHVVDAVDELHVPDRALYLLDGAGRPVKPARVDAWIRAAAERAGHGPVDVDHETEGAHPRTLRLHAERFALASGARMIAVAVADQVELEDRYAELIAAFGGASLFAVVLVTGAVWLLLRQSTAPVERNIAHMRRFMADAAHELRTPITVLRSSAEVALQQPRDAAAYAAALGRIEEEGRRMGRIVEDLLTLARADAGERPIARARVFLDDVTLDAVGAARALAASKGVELSVDEFEEAAVDGDATLLRQLVMILLDNAVKFTPRGGHVRVRVGDSAGRATLLVADDGVGVPVEQLPHVFERFWRGEASRDRGDGADGADGAGLGLAIARWITTAHGGDIRLEPAPAGGTVVRVTLPPANGAAPAVSSP